MPIRPEDIENLTHEEEQLVTEIEDEIDRQLRTLYTPHSMPLILIRDLRWNVRQRIIDDYRESGWIVEHKPKPNPCEADALEFRKHVPDYPGR